MADWTDGAQYAPVERPMGFAQPRVEPLAVVPAAPNPADGQPAHAPGGYQRDAQQPPLESLVPALGPHREPTEPFGVDAQAGPGAGAWGSTHATSGWTPNQPLLTSAAPVSSANPWGAPVGDPVVAANLPAPTGEPALPAGAAPATGPGTSIAASATSPTTLVAFGLLLAGVLFAPASTICFFVASFVPLRPARVAAPVRTAFALGFLLLMVCWLLVSASLADFELASVGRLICLAVMAVLGATVATNRSRRA